jgi:RNA polymerase sigma factor (TIGR02999 family)
MPRRNAAKSGAATDQRHALDDLFSATYDELRRMAAAVRRVDANATISTSTLVHEAWIKLAASPGVAPESEQHFKRLAARVMRQIVMDEARRHQADKRGGGRGFVALDDSLKVPVSSSRDLLQLDAALDALAQVSPRQAELVQIRFFGGRDVMEASVLLGVSEATALRDWRAAKAWLAAEIRRTQ